VGAMTDRHAGYIVVLAEDIREDDAEGILNALRMVRGVISVTPVISDHTQAVARERRDEKWRDALRDLARNGPREEQR
jgi:hypothetical protein